VSNAPASAVFPEIDLPSGRKITFRRAKSRDRAIATDQLLAQYPGLSAEMLFQRLARYLPKFALASDNGQAPTPDVDLRFDGWDLADEDFYVMVFSQLHNVSDADMKRVEELAKSLRSAA
jgi:hypothetical protein